MSTTVDINNDELQVGGLEQLEECTIFEETTLVVTQNGTDAPKQQPLSNLKLQLLAASAGDTEETAKVSLKTILQNLSNRIKALLARFDTSTGHAHTGSDSAKISYANLNNKPAIPTALSDLLGDATHRTVTDTEKAFWGVKQTALVSGANIKTVNGVSLLGSGNLEISGGGLNFKYLDFFDFYGSSDESLPAECAEGDICFNRDTGNVFSATAENTWGPGEPVSDSIIYKYKGVAYHYFSGNDLIPLSKTIDVTNIVEGAVEISSFENKIIQTVEHIQFNVATTTRSISCLQTEAGITVNRLIHNNTANAIVVSLDSAAFSFTVPANARKELSILVYQGASNKFVSYVVGGASAIRTI